MPTAHANDADTQFALAQSLWQHDEIVRSEAILRDLAARYPAREDVAILLATLLRSQGCFDAAAGIVFALCSACAFPPEMSLRGVHFIQECQRQSIAAELCETAIARGAATPALLVAAGNIARELGDFAKARARYLQALDAQVDLNSCYVLGALANTLRYTDSGHPDFARFIAHFDNPNFSARSRASTGFGLAKAYDDIGDRESAARVLREANALVRTTVAWSADTWRDFVGARQRESIAPAHATQHPDFVPIFIVGLPRTGTTLTATLLAKHSTARDRGELRTLRFIADKLIGGGHLGEAKASTEAAHLYRTLARQDDAPAHWYIDQDPLNFRYLHIAAALFPQARIVECRRGRRDTALSLWSQDLAHPDCSFVYDFASIADYAAGYDALMRHWRDHLALPIHTVDYETLVTNPEPTLAALREFIGVPAADASATTTTAPINSASVWQARQPLYTRSIERWRAYLPFVPELGRFAPSW